MDAAGIQAKIEYGRAKAASHLGYAYKVCRPAGANNPTGDDKVLIASLLVTPNQRDKFDSPNTFGKAIWWSFHDGSQTQPGDYLIGRGNTFFIASQQDLLPIQLVECNRVLSFFRVAQETGEGAVGYGGENDDDDTPLMANWPASVLQGSKGERNDTGLPLDVKNPWWIVLLPAVSGVELKLSDRVSDDLGNRYWIHQVEETNLGYRLKLMQVQP